MASNEKSKVLQDDAKIYEVSESMNAASIYFPLGRSLLESEAEVSNIIGKTSIDFDEVVIQCLFKWRNANGSRAGPKLLSIFKNLRLTGAASCLEKELNKSPSCLGNDVFIPTLAEKIDSVTDHQELGIKLLGSQAKLENIIGINNPPYKDSLYKVLIKFRNREGAGLETFYKLREILIKHRQRPAVEALDNLEFGRIIDERGGDYLEESSSVGSSNSDDIKPLRSQEPMQSSRTQNPSPAESSHSSSQQFYDVYLVYTKNTDDVKRVKKILAEQNFTVMTADDRRLGLLAMRSVENALETCSHVVVIVSKEDCEGTDTNNEMTIEMAFQTKSENPCYGRILTVVCCEDSYVPLRYKGLTFSRITDENLETRLADSIDREVRRDREKTLSSSPEGADGGSTSCDESGDGTPKSLQSTAQGH